MEHRALKLLLVAADAAETRSKPWSLAAVLPAGSSFLSAGYLRDGLTLLASEEIDAVLLDLELPDSQGLNTLEQMREHARRVAVIVLADRDDESLVEKAFECGVQDYLVKGEVNAAALARNVRHAVERKRGELTLQCALQENNRLAAAIANVTVGVVIVDAQAPDWPIVFSNPAFSAITGYPHGEIVGRNCRFLQGARTDRGTMTRLRLALQHRQPFCGELLNYRKDGTPFWNEVSIGPVFDEANVLTHFVGVTHDVTARKTAEEARSQSEARFRTLTDAVPQVIWTNEAGGKADYFNGRWFEYSGLSLEQSTGLGWQAIVHPEDAPASKEKWQRALAAGELFDTEYRLRRADGTYRWHIGRNVPLKDEAGHVLGWFGSATDIEDLKVAEAAVAAAQERLRLIVDNAHEHAIVSMDLERRITSWNPGAELILGYTAAEMMGRTLDVTFLPEDQAVGRPEKEAHRALAEGRAGGSLWRRRKGGSVFWAECALLPMRTRSDGEVVGFVGILSDESEVQQARHDLEQSREKLVIALQAAERACVEAETANAAKDHFLAVLSHELRTPLTPVLMAVHTLALRRDLPKPVIDSLAMIRRNVELEAHFIDEMLDLTRLARGKLELALAPMDLHEAIQRAVEITEPDFQAREQRLQVDLQATEHRFNGDSARLQQVCWNLLKNAAKFTPAGGRIWLRTRQDGLGWVEVEVADTGIGMEPAALARVFHPFEQADTSIAQLFGGLGLGLAIAKASVEAHGGTIHAASSGPGRGAIFTVRLPLVSPTGSAGTPDR